MLDPINLIIVLIVIGFLLWLANRLIPMDANIRTVLNAVVLILVVLWILNLFGFFHPIVIRR